MEREEGDVGHLRLDDPDLFAEDVAKIAYEGLDLSHLYPKR